MRCFLQLHHSLFRIAGAAVLTICSVLSPQVGTANQKPSRSADSLLGSFSTSERYSEQNNISISISVRREDGTYQLGFQGMGRALHGHAPEGSGHGQIKEGVFRFQFEDSFSNRDSGTFRKVGDHYLLHIDISDVAEPRIMSAYGDTPLYRDKA
jgi:hypothetical protein